jgi:hypothetical protein
MALSAPEESTMTWPLRSTTAEVAAVDGEPTEDELPAVVVEVVDQLRGRVGLRLVVLVGDGQLEGVVAGLDPTGAVDLVLAELVPELGEPALLGERAGERERGADVERAPLCGLAASPPAPFPQPPANSAGVPVATAHALRDTPSHRLSSRPRASLLGAQPGKPGDDAPLQTTRFPRGIAPTREPTLPTGDRKSIACCELPDADVSVREPAFVHKCGPGAARAPCLG